MQKLLLLGFALFLFESTYAQVEKNIIVEHFTNTVCGICSFRNPDLFENLNANPQIFHLATHPSSPYPSCLFNQHNTPENDARTNFYNIYGSTPKIVIQGQVYTQSTNTWDNEDLFDDYQNQTSPASIQIQQSKSVDGLNGVITLKTEATHNLGDLNLYVVLAEDTIFYDAPNGEKEHYNVFRKNVSEGNGWLVNLPETVGEEVSFSISSDIHPDWNLDRIFTMAILQDAVTNEVVQIWAVPASSNEPISNIRDLPQLENITVLPNPTTDKLTIQLVDNSLTESYLYDLNGKILISNTFTNSTQLSLANLPQGAYILKVLNENGMAVQKILKE